MSTYDEPHPYSLRSLTYHTEKVRAKELQRVFVYKMFVSSLMNFLKYSYSSFSKEIFVCKLQLIWYRQRNFLVPPFA